MTKMMKEIGVRWLLISIVLSLFVYKNYGQTYIVEKEDLGTGTHTVVLGPQNIMSSHLNVISCSILLLITAPPGQIKSSSSSNSSTCSSSVVEEYVVVVALK